MINSFELNHTYDHVVYDQFPMQYKYLTERTVGLPDRPVIITHTINVPLLRKHFPQHREIVVIKSDILASTRRRWALLGRQVWAANGKDEETSIVEHVRQFQQYYSLYEPFVLDCDVTVVDIDAQDTEFGKMMHQEINSIQSLAYDSAWNSYDISGDAFVKTFPSVLDYIHYDIEFRCKYNDNYHHPTTD